MSATIHEDFHRQTQPQGTSDRGFGWVFAAFFALVAFWPMVRRHESPRWWALGVAFAFVVAALVSPSLLHPLNLLWIKLGLLLSKVTTPIFAGGLFFLVFTPAGFVLRLMGKDFMRLRPETGASYWNLRQPPGPAPESLRHQF